MSVQTDVVRKFRYKVNATFNRKPDEPYLNILVEDMTPSKRQVEHAVRQMKGGPVYASGRPTYTELVLRLCMKTEEQDTFALFIDDVQTLKDHDIDTVDVEVQNLVGIGGDAVATTQLHQNCKVVSWALDPMGRKLDDDFLYIELTLQPQLVTKVG